MMKNIPAKRFTLALQQVVIIPKTVARIHLLRLFRKRLILQMIRMSSWFPQGYIKGEVTGTLIIEEKQ